MDLPTANTTLSLFYARCLSKVSNLDSVVKLVLTNKSLDLIRYCRMIDMCPSKPHVPAPTTTTEKPMVHQLNTNVAADTYSFILQFGSGFGVVLLVLLLILIVLRILCPKFFTNLCNKKESAAYAPAPTTAPSYPPYPPPSYSSLMHSAFPAMNIAQPFNPISLQHMAFPYMPPALPMPQNYPLPRNHIPDHQRFQEIPNPPLPPRNPTAAPLAPQVIPLPVREQAIQYPEL